MFSQIKYPASNLSEDDYHPGTGWELAWADEFDAEVLDPLNWTRQVAEAGRFNEEWQAYTASEANAYLEDHCLVLKAVHTGARHGPDQYTSARLHTASKQVWKHGKVAARIQLPYGEGMWPAFWMLGANCNENGGDTAWPFCGEIDILELYGSKSDAVVEGNLHYANTTGVHESMGAASFRLEKGIFAEQFHIFELEWNAHRILWRVDGIDYASTDISDARRKVFNEEFFIILNIAVGGTWAGRPNEDTNFPQFMFVDWLRVYQKVR